MAIPKFSTFIVGMIFASMVISIFALTMAEFKENYGVSYSDNESLEVLSKLDKLNSTATEYKQSLFEDTNSSKQGIIGKVNDILGALFERGYQTTKTVYNSFDVFVGMTDAGMSRMGLGSAGVIIKTAIISAIIIILVVGIVLSILVKRET